MELIAVRVAVLRENCAQQMNNEKLAKLGAIEAFCEGLAPMLDESSDNLSVFSSLDPVEQLKAIVARARNART